MYPVQCDRQISRLLDVARDLGAACLATGHYVQRVDGKHGAELHCGIDPAKDQSYFLHATTRDQLEYLRFPLGGLTKAAVRGHATRLGLDVAAKPDSQDICFVPSGDYTVIVRKLRPDADAPGDIVDLAGRVLGRHSGIVDYTIGQRRGLELGGLKAPVYVVALDAPRRRVVVGPRAALAVTAVVLDDFNWIGDGAPDIRTVGVKVRSMAAVATGKLIDSDQPRIAFATPEFGVAPGQAAVLYDGSRVVGGGTIAATVAANASEADRLESASIT